MDWEAFKIEVQASVNEGLHDNECGDLGSGDPFYAAIGETWEGALYGYRESALGEKEFYIFDNEEAQANWHNTLQDMLGV